MWLRSIETHLIGGDFEGVNRVAERVCSNNTAPFSERMKRLFVIRSYEKLIREVSSLKPEQHVL